MKTLLIAFLAFPLYAEALSTGVMQAVTTRRLTYAEQVMRLGPVAYWRLGEASGTTAKDYVTGQHDGTYVNTPTLGSAGLITGNGGTSVTFTLASSEHVTVPDHVDLRFTGNWSGIGWIDDWTGGGFAEIYSKVSADAATAGYSFGAANSDPARMASYSGAGAHVVATTAVNDGARHMLGAVTDGTEYVYLDGVQDGTGSINQPSADTSAASLGRRGISTPDNFMDGRMQEVALFNYTLSEAQVNLLYRVGTGEDVSPGDFTACCVP